MPKPSPLAPDRFPDLPVVPGVRLATGAAEIRYQGRDDVLLVELTPDTAVAGVFTQSTTAAAPVLWCRENVRHGAARGLVVNSGNANAFTGQLGERSVERSVSAVAALFGCSEREVFVASTGVIGEQLPDKKVTDAVGQLQGKLAEGKWEAAARAIMTTDTYPKGCTRTAQIDTQSVVINGITKGSGMIAPNMATMLAFVFTDAAIAAAALQALLTHAVRNSFNCITVDSDTSTSDTLLLFATGKAGGEVIVDARDPRLDDFREQLDALMLDLAHQIVRDGEGATKFVTIKIRGAESDDAARRVGLAIANSPLVKTAIAGGDANWGRIVMAVGKAGEAVDRDRLAIFVGGILLAECGAAVPDYDETPVAAHMRGREIEIAVDLNLGSGQATVWTCDLTHEYIDINADYRS
ncbi:MAG: bifunctional glutamate N-acetyltransferase/amino-acid acetyltransferase ArgJ [Hyphomicrobiales bacterium]|nr:bifunctional glutamate N-acetyltransferase/amino-acid acetyltransferase ArgJ [Hyphomicrobiales bacterium]